MPKGVAEVVVVLGIFASIAELEREPSFCEAFTGAIERGENDLRITTLVKLANTFNISIGQLFRH